MSKGLLNIHKPELRCDEKKAYLAAIVDDNGIEKEVCYGVPLDYAKYLTVERSDAFVVALLYYAMIKEYDISWETPCSERLIFQLKNWYIPIVSTTISYFNNIKLKGLSTDDGLSCAGGVGTAISGGVDSTYTIKKFLNCDNSAYKLTHVLLTDCFTTGMSDEYQQDYLKNYLDTMPKQASELNLKFLFVEFHLDTNFSVGTIKSKAGEIHDGGLYTLKFCSIPLALQKLFKIYYFSSGHPAADFDWISKDTDSYDIFTLPLISTNKLIFYPSGCEVTRGQKVEAIADWEYAQKHLQVCGWDNDNNCGSCGKCIRTMSELYVIDKLESYYKRFPVESYKKHIVKNWAKMIALAHSNHLDERQALNDMKKHGKKVPARAYIIAPLFILKDSIRNLLHDKKWARKIYRKFNLDRLIYGRATKKYER